MEVNPGYKQTEVGVIPEEWEVKPLSGVAQIRSGIAKNANTAISDPVLVHYLRVANVQDGFLDLSEMSKIEVSRSDLQRFAVLPGDVLMNEGGDRDKLGRGSIWRGEFQPCIHQNHVFVVRCGSQVVPDYLTIWSAGSIARRYFLVAGKQTTNLASINKTALGELPVLVPNATEQRAIAEALSDVDGLLGGLDRLIAKKRDLKQATMQQLLTGQTRLPGFHGEWEVKRLGELASLKNGYAFKSDTYTNLGAFKVVTIANVQDGYMTAETCNTIAFEPKDLQPHQRLNVGDILISMTGNVGRVCRVNEVNCLLNQRVGKLVATGTATDFLFAILRKPSFILSMTGAAKGGAQPNLSATEITELSINIPKDTREQTAIAEVLTDMDAELAALEQRRVKTRALKQAMMQELLTGRIRLVQPTTRRINSRC